MSKKRKVIILSCMIALLAVTAVFNFLLTTEPLITETEPVSSAGYFATYRTERLTMRNEEIVQLDEVISSSENSSAERNEALSLKTQLTKITEQELLLESLIKAYGFEDVFVVIGLDSENVNVITKSEDLSAENAILIYTVISEENVASAENIKIIPIS